MKATKAYAIKDPKGEILPFTFKFTEKESKEIFIEETAEFETDDWDHYYFMGYDCVPVEITEITDKKA